MARNLPPASPKVLATRQLVQAFLRKHPATIFNIKQLASYLEFTSSEDREALEDTLDLLTYEGHLDEVKRGQFRSVDGPVFVEGKIDMPKGGGGYVKVDGFEEDVQILPGKTLGAMQGDVVKVLLWASKAGRRVTGEVDEVLARAKTRFVGTLQVHPTGRYGFLIPDGRKGGTDLFIRGSDFLNAQDGDKVIAEVVEWPRDEKEGPVGAIVSVLGRPGDHHAEMNAIIAEFGLPLEFPEEVQAQADAIPEKISKKEIERRWDLRGVPTFTIDPIDAKDFDDALSVRMLPNGRTEVGVHIADVSAYLVEGSPMDKEALERATSVYLVDRVIPMLPEKLSNHVCSLRPHEDKLCFSCVVVLDEDANIEKEWYGRTVIHSAHRYAYEGAQAVLDGEDGPFKSELLQLNKLAYMLKEKRFENGAISFETEEVKFTLDDAGKPLGVFRKVRVDAHKLIEEFMLLANRLVAEYMFKSTGSGGSSKPFVYRVHDTPTEEKLAAFAKMAGGFGHRLVLHNAKTVSRDLNRLMKDIEGKPEQNLLQGLAIRTMPKAFYTGKKTSHYGLAFEYYTHFTSPIRRYPDVIAHRLLALQLEGKKPPSTDYIESQAKHSSDMEVRASEAERASIKYKQVEFLSSHIGEEFPGIISGVQEWGIYVELSDSKCEGMVKLATLDDDYYQYEEEHHRVRGNRSGRTYQLGDALTVKVVGTDLARRTIDFERAEVIERAPGEDMRPSSGGRGGSRGRDGGGRGRSGGGGGSYGNTSSSSSGGAGRGRGGSNASGGPKGESRGKSRDISQSMGVAGGGTKSGLARFSEPDPRDAKAKATGSRGKRRRG